MGAERGSLPASGGGFSAYLVALGRLRLGWFGGPGFVEVDPPFVEAFPGRARVGLVDGKVTGFIEWGWVGLADCFDWYAVAVRELEATRVTVGKVRVTGDSEVALVVHPVVFGTQHGQVLTGRGAAVFPVDDVMGL